MQCRRARGNGAMSVMDDTASPKATTWSSSPSPARRDFAMAPIGQASEHLPTSVSLFDQGLSQVLQAAATGLDPKRAYVLALATHSDGSGKLEPLAGFMTNPAGSAIVNALGPIRQIVQSDTEDARRYLVIAPGSMTEVGKPVQVQAP